MFSAVADTVESAVSAVYGLAYSQAAAADAIGKTSALMGMQVGELQALRSAGMHAGMSLESVDSALQKFSINTGKAAAGEKTQIALFNALAKTPWWSLSGVPLLVISSNPPANRVTCFSNPFPDTSYCSSSSPSPSGPNCSP